MLPLSVLLYYINEKDQAAHGCILLGPNASATVVENEKESKFELKVCAWPGTDPHHFLTLGYSTRTEAEHWRDAVLNCRYQHLEAQIITMQRSLERLHGFYTSIESLAHVRM